MLFDTISLLAGSDIENLVVVSGSTFPASSTIGELFYHTTDSKLYVFTGSIWDGILTSAVSVTSVAGRTGTIILSQADITSLKTTDSPTFASVTASSFNGNASSASIAAQLTTPRNINGVSFNGTSDITVPSAAGTLTGTTLASNVTASSLTSVGTVTAGTWSGSFGAVSGANLTSLTGANVTGTVPSATSAANASTAAVAIALQTARAINGVSFDGTADITITSAAGTLTGTTLASNVVASSLTSVGTLTSLTVTGAVTGSSFNSITGLSAVAPSPVGIATVGTSTAAARADHIHVAPTTITGNAGTATALQTARTINGVAFDGTANVTIPAASNSLTGTALPAAVVSSSLTSVGTLSALNVVGNAAITGTLTMTGDIMPSANVAYNMGSPTMQWHSVYVGPGTLYVNGKPVIEDNSGTITVGTSPGQNLMFQTTGGGILQLDGGGANGGYVSVRSPLQVTAGNNLTSSDGNPIQFANAIGVDSLIAHTANGTLTINRNGTGVVQINSPLTVTGATTHQTPVTISDTTATTTTSTGALIVSGGAGIGGTIVAGSILNTPISGSTGSFTTLGTSGVVTVTNSTQATGANTGALIVTGGASIGGNAYISGNLTVAGSLTTASSSVITVTDPMLYLGSGNASDVVDLGFIAAYTPAGFERHTGVIRDASDGIYKFFDSVASEPSSTVDFSSAVYSPVKMGALTATTGTFSDAVSGTSFTGATNGTHTGAVVGNASTATTLQTARQINGVAFDGSANVTIAAAAGTLTGTALAAGITSSSLTTVGTIGSGAWQGTPVANAYLANSSLTVNGVAISLGGSGTVTAAAGTLTGSALASGVTSSSLTSVGTLTSLAVTGAVTAGSFSGPLTGNVTGNVSGSAASITGTYAGSITSAQVTAGLGFTPYNATNPSGWTSNLGTVTSVSVASANGISGSVANAGTTPAITLSLGAITPTSVASSGAISSTTLTTSGIVYLNGASLVSSSSSALGILYSGSSSQYGITLKAAADITTAINFINAAGTAIGSITQTASTVTLNGNVSGTASSITGTYAGSITSAQVTTGLGFTPYNATNPSGWTSNVGTVTSVSGTGTVSGLTLSGSVTTSGSLTLGGTLSLTSGNVTTALGFTPYNATNPNGYISSISSANVTTALGFTPYNATNPNGYITSSGSISGNAATATTASSLSGFTTSNASNPVGSGGNGLTQNTIGYVSGMALLGQTDGAIYSQSYSTSWMHQIYGDYRTGQIAVRGNNSGTWQGWRIVLDSSNYSSYAPTLTGTGASGTWGISITGNAGSLQGYTLGTQPSGIVQRDSSGYIANSYFYTSGGGSERNASGMGYFSGHNSSDYYIRSYTAQAAATALSGSTMNINGSSTSCSGNAATVTTLNATQVFSAINGQSNSDWYRTSGSTGWYSSTYAVGMYATSTGLVQTYNSSSLQVNGTMYATGNVIAYYSDMRLKTKTGEIIGALDKVNKLSGFYYTINDLGKSLGFKDEQVQIGVSAQEVQSVVPEAVSAAPFDISRDEETMGKSVSGEDYLTVQYERLVPLLIEAIKELNAKVDGLQAEIKTLKA